MKTIFLEMVSCLIEWAELIEEILPKNAHRVLIEKDLEKGLDYRRITV